jgi:hypothetical protein
MKPPMKLAHQRSAYVLPFILGFLVGLVVFELGILFAGFTGQAVPIPRFWSFWVFDANPVVYVLCDLMHRGDLCIGLAFDGGPLERVELAWLLFAQGTPFGLAAVATLAWFRRRRRPVA